MKATPAVQGLDGTSVLVASVHDHQNPPVGVRGTLEVRPDPVNPGDVAVDVMIETPEMFSMPTHSRRIPLDEKAIEPLFEPGHPGMRTVVVDDAL